MGSGKLFTFIGPLADRAMAITMNKNQYVPALKYSWLTRFYDPIVALGTREQVFREKLLNQAEIKSGDRVLDLACGTGTFSVMVKNRFPGVEITGLDGDPNILVLARKKALAAGEDIVFDESMSFSMPYADGEFDTVFSSLFFHHLQSVDKLRTMKEVYRVLKPGGTFHVCDWGRPYNLLSRMKFLSVRLLDGFEVTRDNIEGRLPAYINGVGFVALEEPGHVETWFGTLDFLSAKKPGI